MSRYNFKMILSFIQGSSSTDENSNFVQKSNTKSYLSLENIQFSCYSEQLSPQTLRAIQEKSLSFPNPQIFAFLNIAYVHVFTFFVSFFFRYPLPSSSYSLSPYLLCSQLSKC